MGPHLLLSGLLLTQCAAYLGRSSRLAGGDQSHIERSQAELLAENEQLKQALKFHTEMTRQGLALVQAQVASVQQRHANASAVPTEAQSCDASLVSVDALIHGMSLALDATPHGGGLACETKCDETRDNLLNAPHLKGNVIAAKDARDLHKVCMKLCGYAPYKATADCACNRR
eukprot:gnl/MRDRNA2_/MRDRNA2_36215_c0_seq1.p1 gnl/MRDRNA2_/MRDRNA2_36215_c0~~gnl/MRDRNA2_/MRDRNA2_36215_c0_seq1.p1  ORF type:complete len:173 (-),score=38.60 gnl/MRDRNA2_/MRDRNA2_36215_c0_seq1:18-536(-)